MLGRHMHTNSDDVAFLLPKGPFVLNHETHAPVHLNSTQNLCTTGPLT